MKATSNNSSFCMSKAQLLLDLFEDLLADARLGQSVTGV